MFYAHFVLSKRGPLAKIWLAAHWEKKLTKAQVYETNIDSTVDAILEPKVKLALRTSGHLLLGVVRIYSRKAKYLLADCNEAFVKIKMAFRPGVLDVQDENREAAPGSITLVENFDDFDANFNDFEMDAMDAPAKFAVNQSRPEEITIKEVEGHVNFITDDGFGDLGFDDRDLMREASSIEDSLFQTPAPIGDVSSIITADQDVNKDSELGPPVDLGDDGFGDEGLGDADLLGGPGLFEDAPMNAPDLSNIEPQLMDDTITEPPNISAVDDTQAAPTLTESTVQPSGLNSTTLLPDEDRAFALEPLETTSMVSGFTGVSVDRRPKRRRKLMVDDQKGIDSQSMKQQLVQTNDIVTTLDLAPPTRQLMQWKEQGAVDKLLTQPSRNIIHKSLHKLFTRNLTVLANEITEEEKNRSKRNRSPEIEREREPTPVLEHPQSVLDMVPEGPHHADFPPDNTATELPVDLPDEQIKEPTPAIDETPRKRLRSDKGDNSEDKTNNTSNNLSADEVDSADEEMGAPPLDEESTILAEESTGNELEDKRLNQRTHAMLQNLRKLVKRDGDEPIDLLEKMKRGHSRKQAAAKFYTTLVLTKHSIINVQQDGSFAPILITRGPNFERQL